jgi:hypothetical protein
LHQIYTSARLWWAAVAALRALEVFVKKLFVFAVL